MELFKTEEATSRDYRAMARVIRAVGFSPRLYGPRKTTCFLGAIEHLFGFNNKMPNKLLEVLGTGSFEAGELMDAGWTQDMTEDAAAACEIAADLVAP